MREFSFPGRSNVLAQNGMVATSNPLSSIEAINILTDEINDLTINEVYSTNMPGKLLNSVISGPYLNRSAANNAKEKITKSGFDPRLRTLCKEN